MAWHSPMELHNTPIGHIVTLNFMADINGKKVLAFDLFLCGTSLKNIN